MRDALLVYRVRLPEVQQPGDRLRQVREEAPEPYLVVADLARLAVALALLDDLRAGAALVTAAASVARATHLNDAPQQHGAVVRAPEPREGHRHPRPRFDCQ